jgi:hypothetical protein
MDVQQAQQLTLEAYALCERLAAQACEAQARKDWREAGRVLTVRRAAVRRWGRRLDKWAVAAYGPEVN